MTKSKSFQIIFEEVDGHTYSATFDLAIPLTCRGKFVDVKGIVRDMSQWTRILHSESTLTNVIHYARKLNESLSGCQGSSVNLCCSDISACTQFFTTANMKEIVQQQCCSGNQYPLEACNYCLVHTASFYKYKTPTIKANLGNVFKEGFKPTILLKDENLVITDGINATLISV